MNYKKQLRLWFECLQICYSQSEYAENLERSKDFYEEWGGMAITLIIGLAENFCLMMSMSVSRVSNAPNTITLSIPLNEKISVITSEVKKIVEQRRTEKLIEMGKDPSVMKSKNLGVGKYSFTQRN